MVYQTTASLFMTDSVRVRLIGTNAENDDRVLTVEFAGGTELRFMGPKEKLLRLFRGIETSLIEDDPDNDIFLNEDETEVLDGWEGWDEDDLGQAAYGPISGRRAMHEHERRLIDAAIHFVDIAPNADGFCKAYETLVTARGEYQIVAEARLGDPLKNDAGAFGANSRPTSIRAAFTIPDRGSLRGKMLKLFAEGTCWADPGWTDFELAAKFERDVRTIGSCRLDLLRTGWIQQTTQVRFKPTDLNEKRPCIVWEMTELGRQKYEELYANG